MISTIVHTLARLSEKSPKFINSEIQESIAFIKINVFYFGPSFDNSMYMS